VRKLALLPSIIEKLELLYQRRPVPFQTLNFPVGTQQAAHSDSIHFSSIPERWMCGVWIALEDVDEDNGPLQYYPGSHKLPVLAMHDFGLSPQDFADLSESYPIYEEIVGEMLDASQLKPKRLHMKKGQALIWEANLFHGGSPINDPDRTRLSQVTHYFFEGCAYYSPLQSDLPLGKVVWRNMENIATAEPIQHSYNGRPASAPGFDGSPQMLTLDERQRSAEDALEDAQRQRRMWEIYKGKVA
jgi:ectoine hydroxylase-related dioxygenase (phytanoyl-CoA dioxygenase family)